ncbi:MAG: DEAD/DEAH box helicase [Planctomycetota bacterium]
MPAFSDFDLLPALQTSLAEQQLTTPTEIQSLAIPILMAGRSVVAVSETGSGKTLAYALPLLHALKTLEDQGQPVAASGKPRAVVLVPTRELGEQVARVFKKFTHSVRLRVRTVLGGTKFDVARANVSGPFEVLVATTGRMIKLLELGSIDLGDVRTLVFDEADRMLDAGFLADAERIVDACPHQRQLAMFSATVSIAVQALVKNRFETAEVVRSKGSHKTVATLTTQNRMVDGGKRLPLLQQVLKENVTGGTLMFANTREQCDALAGEVKKLGVSCTIYRGEMDKVERRKNLELFRDGKTAILISTDLASRGLDIEHVARVVNYHLPVEIENYIHRVGRTARAGRPGLVVNFVTERDEPLMQKVAKLAAGTSAGKASSRG